MNKKSYLTLLSPLDKTVRRDQKFEIQSLVGEEGLCENFSYRLKLASFERLSDDEFNQLIGKSLTVDIAYSDPNDKLKQRYINGIVMQITELGMSRAPLIPDVWHYEAEISSWLTQLKYVKDCRIFQENGSDSMRIISELLRENGFHDFSVKIGARPPRRDYTVLYNETLYNFIIRLLQEDGIVFRFEHFKDEHRLIFTRNSLSLPKIAPDERGRLDKVKSFFMEGNLMPVNISKTSSYDWQNPPVKYVQKPVGSEKNGLAHFEYPGKFDARSEGENRAKRRSQALQVKMWKFSGHSTIRTFTAGHNFILDAPGLPDLHDKSYLLTKIKINADSGNYQNEFIAVPSDQPFLPLAEEGIEKPVIYGSQTAIVSGDPGSTNVETDKWGRVMVRFHWDHSAKNPKHTSAFIRVAGPAAGAGRGFVFTPKIGEEVVVTFEDGDPDKPLIMGSVYSANHKLPFSPLSNPYKSTIKTGSDKDANQILFDDKPGSENLNIKAKKDMKIEVGGSLNIKVAKDISIKAKSLKIEVAKDVTITAGGSIANIALLGIVGVAGGAITDMAVGGVINFAGGIVKNAAGGMISNTAILSVANTSAMGLQQEAAAIIANTAVGAVLNTGSEVVNTGDLAVINTSSGAIINSASGDINNEAILQKNKSLISNTEADGYSIKGITKVNG